MQKTSLILAGLLICTNMYAQKTQETGIFHEGLAYVKIDDKYGFCDTTWTVVIPARYDAVGNFSEGLAWVRQLTADRNYIYGYIDKNGNEVIPAIFTQVEDFSEGLACVILNGKYTYIDKTGTVVLPVEYLIAWGFSDGLAKVYSRAGYGLIDKTGHEVVPPKYGKIGEFSKGTAKVYSASGKCGLIDKTGREIISPKKYDNVENYSDGAARVYLNGKYGYIDNTGNEVIPLIYDGAGDFSEGMAPVRIRDKNKGKYGYIDKTGKTVISPKYDDTGDFSEDLAPVKLNGKYGYIDKKGKTVILPKYDNAGIFCEGRALVATDKKIGYIDKTGKTFTPLKYDRVSWSGSLLYVTSAGKHGVIDVTGKVVEPLRYSNRDIQIIRKNPLISYIKQMNDYRSKLEKSPVGSGSFRIERPYLIIYAGSDISADITDHLSFYKYSENDFNEQSINDLKTVIIKYDYPYATQTYVPSGSRTPTIGEEKKVTTYGSYLIYFDVARKECVGHDVMPGPELPAQAQAWSGMILTSTNVALNDIVEKIETRLATSDREGKNEQGN